MHSKYLWVISLSLLIITILINIINLRKFPFFKELQIIIIIISIPLIIFIILSGLKKKRSKTKLVNNLKNVIIKECYNAISMYLKATNKIKICRRSFVYKKKWFFLCSTEKTGVNDLLESSGLNFQFIYLPNSLNDYSNNIRWYFTNEAVWVQFIGNFLNNESSEIWKAAVNALDKFRKKITIDAIIMIIDLKEILVSENNEIVKTGNKIRNRIDYLLEKSSREIPLYMISNNTNHISGFQEFYSEENRDDHSGPLGRTIRNVVYSQSPLTMFKKEFNIFIKTLESARLEKLYKEKDEEKRRLLFQFVLKLSCLQKKMELLIIELFDRYNFNNCRLILKGFYFTANQEIKNLPVVKTQLSIEKNLEENKETKYAFVLSLFKEILINEQRNKNGKEELYNKQNKNRKKIIILSTLILFVISIYLIFLHLQIDSIVKGVEDDLKLISSKGEAGLDIYKVIDTYKEKLEKLRKSKKSELFKICYKLYKFDEIELFYEKNLKRILKKYYVKPTVKYMEIEISERINDDDELTKEDYDKLYETLKIYLLLTDKYNSKIKDYDFKELEKKLSEKTMEVIVKNNKATSKKTDGKIDHKMSIYLNYLVKKEFPAIKMNERLVSGARNRLMQYNGIDKMYFEIIKSIKEKSPEITINQMLNDDIIYLKSKKTINSVYTKNGFKDVMEAIVTSSKHMCKNDWVMNGDKAIIIKQEDIINLRKKLIDIYIDDFKKQWIDFLKSIRIEPFNDISEALPILHELGSEKSEILNLLNNINNLCQIDSEIDKYKDNKIPYSSMISKKVSDGKKGIFEDYKSIDMEIMKLRKFIEMLTFKQYENGSQNFASDYKQCINDLVNGITEMKIKGENVVTSIFNGKENDPLYKGYQLIKKALILIPDERTSSSVGNILICPYEYAAKVLKRNIMIEINHQWESEVLTFYKSNIFNKYPFDYYGGDVHFDDVEEFFRPRTGIYWNFYDKVLSGFLIKKNDLYELDQNELEKLSFNQHVLQSINSVETLTETLFKADGRIQKHIIKIHADESNYYKGNVILNNKFYELGEKKEPVQIMWPDEKIDSIGLQIEIGEKELQEKWFYGTWAFLKLIKEGKIEMINRTEYNVEWRMNVSGIYNIFYKIRISMQNEKHPFNESVYRSVSCPKRLFNDQ